MKFITFCVEKDLVAICYFDSVAIYSRIMAYKVFLLHNDMMNSLQSSSFSKSGSESSELKWWAKKKKKSWMKLMTKEGHLPKINVIFKPEHLKSNHQKAT